MVSRLQLLAVMVIGEVLCMIIGAEAARGLKYDSDDPIFHRTGDFRPSWHEQFACVLLIMVEVKVMLLIGRKLKLFSPEGTHGRYDTDWNKMIVFCTFFFAFFKVFVAIVVTVNMFSEDYLGIKLINTVYEARTTVHYVVHTGGHTGEPLTP